ncbi:MAG: class I SAM-dependent methyltransferase [bacterium]|nr:class I SAM-dependent methyltransferase [bacterium]
MLAEVIRVNFPSLNGELAVDLGCGTGEFTLFLSDLGFDAVGVDVSQRALAEARARHPQLRFEIINDERLPLSDSSVDLIWSSEVIEHVFDVMGWLAEANRSLKPGGIMVLTTPYHGFFKMLAVLLTSFGQHFDPRGSHIRFFDKKSLLRCLNAAGFQPCTRSGYGRPWPLWKSFFVVSRKVRQVRRSPTLHASRS